MKNSPPFRRTVFSLAALYFLQKITQADQLLIESVEESVPGFLEQARNASRTELTTNDSREIIELASRPLVPGLPKYPSGFPTGPVPSPRPFLAMLLLTPLIIFSLVLGDAAIYHPSLSC